MNDFVVVLPIAFINKGSVYNDLKYHTVTNEVSSSQVS